MTMRIETNGVHLEVDVHGDGPAVLLVHGWPDDHHLWDGQIAALTAAGYRTIAPDLRGFGASSWPDDVADYALKHLAGDLLGVHLGRHEEDREQRIQTLPRSHCSSWN